MSVALAHPIPRQPAVLNSAALWPAYNEITSNTRLLGRTKYVSFAPLNYPTATEQNAAYNGKGMSYSKSHYNRQPRSGTPLPTNKSRLLTPLNTDLEEDEDTLNKENETRVYKEKQSQLQQHDNAFLNGSSYNSTESYSHQIGNTIADNMAAEDSQESAAALRAFYTTSTQRLYQGVDWPNRMALSPVPPKTTKEPDSDIITFRYESKRYDPRSEKWQKYGSRPFSWDYIQTRDGHHVVGPINFCSPGKKVVHIPGYMGHVSGGPGEMDNPVSTFISANKLRTPQPKGWETARKGNIPGYKGCVLYSEYQPACVNDPNHLRSTASRSYREHDEIGCNSKSPFKKMSSMSRMVTLTHPFNPFNKIY